MPNVNDKDNVKHFEAAVSMALQTTYLEID